MSQATQVGPFLPSLPVNISDQLAKFSLIAETAYNESFVYLNDLNAYLDNYTVSNFNIQLPSNLVQPTDFVIPDKPNDPHMNVQIPNLPSDFVSNPVEGISLSALGTLPILTATEPSLQFPNAPSPLTATPPNTNVNIQTDFDFPPSPDGTLPLRPALLDIVLPVLDPITLPDFSLALPTSGTAVLPGLTFQWNENSVYTDSLLTDLQTTLADRITNGGTGLNPTVENAIWDRGRTREEATSLRTEYKILVEAAQTNFTRPQGSTFAALEYAVQEAQNKIIDLSRDIMIKQAELEQANIKFSLEYAINLEQMVSNLWNEQQKRKFDAAKYIQDVGIELYKASIQKITIDLEIYKAYNITFNTLLQKELTKLNIYKEEIAAQQLIGTINEQSIRIYVSQLEGIKTTVDLYRAENDAIKTRIEAESLKLTNLKSQVEVYSAQVAAKRDEYVMYSEGVKAQQVREEVYATQVKAYATRIDAYAKNADALAKVSEVNIDVEKLRLQEYLAQLDTVLKLTQIQESVFAATVDLYKGQTTMFAAEVAAESSKAEIEIKQIQENINYQSAVASIAIENAKINIQNAYQAAQLNIEAMKSGAAVSAQLAASSLSAVNLSASASISSGTSSSYSESNDVS
jgi:hypothetical protein